jgi:Fic family protein
MQNKSIWQPIKFYSKWATVNTEKFDNIFPSWERKRAELGKEPAQYERFIDQLKRKQAIDTGIIEQMYDLKRGVTETFIREGFIDSYLQHGDTNIAPNLLMDYLRDNFNAIDFVFDFVKNARHLSVSYIKELHHLITRHQEATDAIDSMGNYVKIALLKGQFKQKPNNPVRNGIIYSYCPPEQVESEMDNLINIFNTDLATAHVLVKASFLHHAFVQIHPFQDGNGRMARLLSSFVLIREGLFPFSIDRDERSKYIDSLESADRGEYQPIVDIISANQIASIGSALNWQTFTNTAGYDSVIQTLEKKLHGYSIAEAEQRNQRIRKNMLGVFLVMRDKMEHYKNDLITKLHNKTTIVSNYCAPDEPDAYLYSRQIATYANQHGYYADLSLNKCWGCFVFQIDANKVYRMIISLHHYGYDNSTFAIGAFLSKAVNNSAGHDIDYIDIPVALPPLTISAEKEAGQLISSINQQVESSVMTALAYIANELG